MLDRDSILCGPKALTELGIPECREAGGAVRVNYQGEGYELEEGMKKDEAGYRPPDSSPPRVRAQADSNSNQRESSEANRELDRIASTRFVGIRDGCRFTSRLTSSKQRRRIGFHRSHLSRDPGTCDSCFRTSRSHRLVGLSPSAGRPLTGHISPHNLR